MSILKVEKVAKSFVRDGKTICAIDDLSFDIKPREFVTIVGPSGCGKSTFLHIAGGFEQASEGKILFDGRPITRPGPDRGMMFQEAALFPWRNVRRNIGWGLEAQNIPAARIRETVEKFLHVVGLQQFAESYPSELSGGMRQRVALARVLAFDPQMLLMDEPFGALDAQTREIMQEELQRVWDQTPKTVLLVTHDIDEAIYMSDRVLVFSARPGRIKRQIDIDLPRPRSTEVRKLARYNSYRNLIWDLLREEVQRFSSANP